MPTPPTLSGSRSTSAPGGCGAPSPCSTACATGTRSASCSGAASSVTSTTRTARRATRSSTSTSRRSRRLYPLAATTDTGVAGDATTDVPTAVVVHGLRLGDAHRVHQIPFGDQDLPPFGSPECTAMLALLDRLDDDVDAVADILLAEGVYQATRGNHERAAREPRRRRGRRRAAPSPSSSPRRVAGSR